jgi:hypothetical protein
MFAQNGPDTGVCSVFFYVPILFSCWGFSYVPWFIPDPSRTGCVLSARTRKRRAKRRGEGHRMDFIMSQANCRVVGTVTLEGRSGLNGLDISA